MWISCLKFPEIGVNPTPSTYIFKTGYLPAVWIYRDKINKVYNLQLQINGFFVHYERI
jgi:hypothetical protein